MTYRELLIELAKLNQEQLDSNVYVKNTYNYGYSPVIEIKLDTDNLPIITY